MKNLNTLSAIGIGFSLAACSSQAESTTNPEPKNPTIQTTKSASLSDEEVILCQQAIEIVLLESSIVQTKNNRIRTGFVLSSDDIPSEDITEKIQQVMAAGADHVEVVYSDRLEKILSTPQLLNGRSAPNLQPCAQILTDKSVLKGFYADTNN